MPNKRKRCANIKQFNTKRRKVDESGKKIIEIENDTINMFDESYNSNHSVQDSYIVEDEQNASEEFRVEIDNEKINIFDESFISNHSIQDSYIVEEEQNASEEFQIFGRRIVDFQHFFDALKMLSLHGQQFGCIFNNLQLISEKHEGLNSKITFKCNNCNITDFIYTCKPEIKDKSEMNINYSAVLATVSVGNGFTQLKKFLANLSIPPMTQYVYSNTHLVLSEDIKKTAQKTMDDAAQDEKIKATELNNIDPISNFPMITVVSDACWSKRSYRSNYSALSGAATIIGNHSKKVVWIGVKNKHCSICKGNINAPEHKCNINYVGPSTGMESALIAEGFKSSEELHGLIYHKLIGDGDSSVNKALQSNKPYKNVHIEKIECRNHLLRNFRSKIITLSKEKSFDKDIKSILKNKVKKMSNYVIAAIKYRKIENISSAEKIALLKSDILNVGPHIFGDHKRCASYFSCSNTTAFNYIPRFEQSQLYDPFMKALRYLSYNAGSLIQDVDSNIVEQFNGIIAMLVGGKRINFSLGNSYETRCFAAVIQFNTSRLHSEINKYIFNCNSNKYILEVENQTKAKNEASVKKYSKSFKQKGFSAGIDKNYGTSCAKEDLNMEDFEKEKLEHVKKLKEHHTRRKLIEVETRTQSLNDNWHLIRKILLTSSNFGVVFKRQKDDCSKLVKNILYNKCINDLPAIAHGRFYEKIAIEQLEVQLGKKIQGCGLHIDTEYNFLGSTPDGLIDEDSIVEIKCPYSIAGKNIDEQIKERKLRCWIYDIKNDKITFNKKHAYYYQVQGQLNILKRKFCFFAVWSSKFDTMKVEVIERDEELWSQMTKKLKKFYWEKLVPEIVDSRFDRNMPLRP